MVIIIMSEKYTTLYWTSHVWQNVFICVRKCLSLPYGCSHSLTYNHFMLFYMFHWKEDVRLLVYENVTGYLKNHSARHVYTQFWCMNHPHTKHGHMMHYFWIFWIINSKSSWLNQSCNLHFSKTMHFCTQDILGLKWTKMSKFFFSSLVW